MTCTTRATLNEGKNYYPRDSQCIRQCTLFFYFFVTKFIVTHRLRILRIKVTKNKQKPKKVQYQKPLKNYVVMKTSHLL